MSEKNSFEDTAVNVGAEIVVRVVCFAFGFFSIPALMYIVARFYPLPPFKSWHTLTRWWELYDLWTQQVSPTTRLTVYIILGVLSALFAPWLHQRQTLRGRGFWEVLQWITTLRRKLFGHP